MKKFLLLIAALIIGFGAKAQSTMQNFDFVDIDGNTYNLYEITDRGNHVFFFVGFNSSDLTYQFNYWLNEAYLKYGCNEREVFFATFLFDEPLTKLEGIRRNWGMALPFCGNYNGINADAKNALLNGEQPPYVYHIDPNNTILDDNISPTNISVFDNILNLYSIDEDRCGYLTQRFYMEESNGDGKEYGLYELNDQGKYVFLYVFNNDLDMVKYMDELNSAYRNYGCNMHEVFIMSICNYADPGHIQMGANYYGIEYPVGGDDMSGYNAEAIGKTYHGQEYPYLVCINPYHIMTEWDIQPISSITNVFDKYGLEPKACTPTTITEHTNNFSLYPNPANDHIVIEGDNINNIVIYNAIGQEVKQITDNSTQVIISTSSMQQGIYFARINNNETIRFSVNK